MTAVYVAAVESETKLLDAWALGDERAAQALLTRHFDRLFRFFELSAPGAAEDLVQETLLAALEGRDSYRADANFCAFLMGIARNKVLMYWRTRSRRPREVDVGALSLEALGASATSVIARRDAERSLLLALRLIPLADQLLLQMHYWDGLTGPELANALDVPEGTVRSRLRSAKARLREHVGQGSARDVDDDSFDAWVRSLRKRLHS
ncbi:MAG: sigma-70 family RNA polymerase sigma factor [Nannocystaceae bacterium]|nr:sigma-70 family RNA polymerase sigma factor [Nannocystaceae bacterium]